MSKRSKTLKLVLSYIINIGVLISALFVDEIRSLPIYFLLPIIILFPVLQLISGNIVDYLREKTANIRLQSQLQKFKFEGEQTQSELDELRQVVVSFLEHSEIYRSRVKNHLKLTEDYLCIIKSSEGLSRVFEQIDTKEMLPFGSTLKKIPGSVRPFERINLFLIPLMSLPGINEYNVKTYIDTAIIPEVKTARQVFLNNLPEDIASLAEPFSYKYIAFLISKGAISHDVRNRKFNREFNTFIVHQQTGQNYKALKGQLGEMVKSKDILALVNWASFAKLNREQSRLIEGTKHDLSELLLHENVDSISQISKLSPEIFFDIAWPILQEHTTERKALNISKKIIDGSKNIVDVLRNHGVRI